jgi:Sec7-like guanine-nucleotide exchange factor
MRIGESLRKFLVTFRLPGEAPLISLVMEHFALNWRVNINPRLIFNSPNNSLQ